MSASKQRGFTIVEFMIATMVFSVILLVVTGGVLYMNRSYQKSLYASRTQAAATSLVDTVAQAIKFSSAPMVSSANGETMTRCFGNRQFLYTIGRQINDTASATATRNAFISRSNTSSCADVPNIIPNSASITGAPKELLGKGMRLGKFEVNESRAPLYTISARVIYGDDEVLCSDDVAGSCDSTETLTPTQLKNPAIRIKCRPSAGSEFCAVSELTTTAYRRL